MNMVEIIMTAMSVTALTVSIWMRYSVEQLTKKNIARMKELEDITRPNLTPEQLQCLDKQFERMGIARKK